MTASEHPPSARALLAFRRRVDAFFGHPQAAAYAAAVPSAGGAPPANADDVLASRLADVLKRLGAETEGDGLTLRKALTLHDGRLMAVSGDATPLGRDEDVRVVTTTTTVLDAERLRVETNVLVFERGGAR